MARRLRDFDPGHCYHLMSRVAHQDYMLWNDECDFMVDLLRRLSIFSGIKVLTYVVLNNHFHLLVRYDEMPEGGLSDQEVLRRVSVLDGEAAASCLKSELKRLSKLPNGRELAARELDRYRVRMYDVSEFMKTFKQRLTVMFNARTGHNGTMWGARFKSVRVQTDKLPLSVVAAYIDKNPVKARMVDNPLKYPWSSFYAAEQGNEMARNGYAIVYGMEGEPWQAIRDQHVSVMGKWGELIDRNGRAFLDGGAFGSEEYIREYYGQRMPKRKSQPVIPIGGKSAWGDLRFARKLSL